jgi:outer membrane protein OmpA-like peptidoglycan-associated protein
MPVHGEFTREPLSPCLFPRIWSDGMDLLYEKSMVNPPIALQKSIVLYTSTLDEAEYRDRIGTDPLRIIAREVFGTYRTDPVISTSDYLKIVSIPDNFLLLKNANVVIICNRDQLTESPLGPKKDKNYYFTYHEIDKALSAIPVSRIDFSNSWEGLKLTIYDIRFSADTANVLPRENGRLDAIASALKLAGPSATFTVDGHTASVGKPAGELNLSIARARKIADELSARGIPANHIVSAGYGGTRPVATNETEEGRAKNRRVEITIHLD